MADFSFVTPRLATGAAVNDKGDVERLLLSGVSHIIDCRGEFDDAPLLAGTKLFKYRSVYLWNGVDDDGQPKPASWYITSIKFAYHALSLRNAKVYAHCAAGVNRGPSTIYAILRAIGLDSLTAENLIRSARPQVGLAYARDADNKLAGVGMI